MARRAQANSDILRRNKHLARIWKFLSPRTRESVQIGTVCVSQYRSSVAAGLFSFIGRKLQLLPHTTALRY